MLKVPKKDHPIDFLGLHGKASRHIQKTHKSKTFGIGWIQYMKKWFIEWDASHFAFTHHITYVAPKFKTIFFE